MGNLHTHSIGWRARGEELIKKPFIKNSFSRIATHESMLQTETGSVLKCFKLKLSMKQFQWQTSERPPPVSEAVRQMFLNFEVQSLNGL